MRPAGGFGQPMNPFRGVHQQKLADGNFYVRKPPRTVTLLNQYIGRAHVLAIDTTDAYGEEVLLARRAFVSVLPNAVFVIDVARTAQPLKMRTHFPLNNRDGRAESASGGRAPLCIPAQRRGNEAL